jgi:hypothetical protein
LAPSSGDNLNSIVKETFMPSNLTPFEQAKQEKQLSLAGELVAMVAQNKRWWLLPIILVLGAMGIMAIFAGTGIAPFIYTMF